MACIYASDWRINGHLMRTSAGKPLNVRPHWAKQWEGLTIKRKGEKRKEIIDYLKEDAYRSNIETLSEKHLACIAKKEGGFPIG